MQKKFYLLVAILALLALIAGCKDNTVEPEPEEGSEFSVILEAVDNSLTNMSGTYSSSTLDSLITAATPPQILSVRSSTIYEVGHIPGALNCAWKEVYDASNLTGINTTDELVVYCYTGHSGALATFCLNAMGYNSVNLKFGIMSWTKDTLVRGTSPWNDSTDCIDEATSTTIESYPATNSLPVVNNTSSTSDAEIVRASVEAYLSSSPSAATTAQTLYDNLNDGDTLNDPFILSVRATSAYEIGHIPGAANIPWRELASDSSALKILPTDRQIVVYCYTGHTGGLATAALNLLGYDAVNLKWGICSWTSDPDVRIASPFSEADFGDYPVETGAR